MQRTGNDSVTGEADAPAGTEGRPRLDNRRPRLAWGAGLLVVAAGLFTLYLRQSMIGQFSSDGASDILQAQSMLHGNLLLSGWWTADASFYTTELPEYMLVTAFRGLRPDVVHISGALTYTLIVLLGALLARGRATGRAGLVRALVAGGIMLAPGILGGTQVFLENPNHVGTAVPILVIFLIIDRARERWYVPVAVCVLLAWTQVADLLGLVAATAPIAGVAVVRLVLLAVRRRPRAEYRYDAMLLAAAAVSYGLASLAERAIRALGGFYLLPVRQQLFAPASELRGNARMMLQAIRLLFGANGSATPNPWLNPIAELHWVGLALAVAGLAIGIVMFFLTRVDRVSQIVTAAVLATLAAGVFTTFVQKLSNSHEVAILLPFGAVLAGRMLPPLISGRRLRARSARAGRVASWVAGSVLAAWLAASLAALCYAATWLPPLSPYTELASWLARHGYTSGISEYWQASAVTVVSGGKVHVASVTSSGGSVRRWESSASWYDPARQKATFVIAAAPHADTPGGGLSVAVVRGYYGRPVRQYTVGTYEIMVYDYNLLTRVTQRAFPGQITPSG